MRLDGRRERRGCEITRERGGDVRWEYGRREKRGCETRW